MANNNGTNTIYKTAGCNIFDINKRNPLTKAAAATTTTASVLLAKSLIQQQ